MRTLWCWRCKIDVPMLDEDEFRLVTALRGTGSSEPLWDRQFGPMLAEYERLTGFHETNASAVYHHRISLYGPPCRSCGKPLRTPRASVCGFCGKPVTRTSERLGIEFDFHLHADPSECAGTQYFELAPGRYRGAHWRSGSSFVHEYAFALFEGIFEKRIPDYDHFGSVEVCGPQWKPVLQDLAALLEQLRADNSHANVPYGSTLRVEVDFSSNAEANRQALAVLISAFQDWLHKTLAEHDCITILGL